jgi:signal transduction histidine kinase
MHLLFVEEDGSDDAGRMVDALTRYGLDVEYARTGSLAGLAGALDTAAWAAVIAPVHFPGFTAAEGLALVRRRNVDLPYIVLSGVHEEDQALDLLRAGANDYVITDRPGRLGPLLERELRNVRLREERRALSAALGRSETERLTGQVRLAATIAHEFNNVLMGISPFVEVIRRGRNVDASLEHIGLAVQRGKRISETILRTTRSEEPPPALDATWIKTIAQEARTLVPPSEADVSPNAPMLHIR